MLRVFRCFVPSHFRVLFVGLALGVSSLGCGSFDASEEPNFSPGYTECGDVFCSPGQHCEQPSLSVCDEGCLTDQNCPGGHICDPDALTPRQCISAQ